MEWSGVEWMPPGSGLKVKGKEKEVVGDCQRAVEIQPDYVRGYVRQGGGRVGGGESSTSTSTSTFTSTSTSTSTLTDHRWLFAWLGNERARA